MLNSNNPKPRTSRPAGPSLPSSRRRLLLCGPAALDFRLLGSVTLADVCTAEVTSTEELKAAMSSLAPDLVLVRKQTLEQLLCSTSGTLVTPEDLEFALLQLPERQVELIRLLAKGLRNHEIASALGVTTRTVKALLSALFIRYDVTNRTELLGLLMEEGHSLAMRPGVRPAT